MPVYRHIAQDIISLKEKGRSVREIQEIMELSKGQVDEAIRVYRSSGLFEFPTNGTEQRSYADIFLKSEPTHPNYYGRANFGVFQK